MTEQEAIMYLEVTKKCSEEGSVGYLQKEMCDVAISALEEIQQYREIGTVEECLEAVEKQKAMTVNEVHVDEYFCPSCGAENMAEQGVIGDHYCPNCGQAIQWEKREEE